MTRRTILRYSYNLGILGVLGSLVFGKNPTSSSELKVVFSLPENMSYDQYSLSVPQWVNFEKFERILSKYRFEGTLLSSSESMINDRTIQKVYYFLNDSEMNRFCQETINSCDYNFEKRQSLGIVSTSYLNGSVKQFVSNNTELKFATKS